MASYKFERFLRQSNDQAFEKPQPAGAPAARSGIFRCDGCGYEITCAQGQALPAADHHPHETRQGAVRWKLVVADGGPPEPAPVAAQHFRGSTRT